MDAQATVDFCRQAIWIALIISAPVLLAGTAIGLLIGLLQALTSIQEQTIGIVMKIAVMILVLAMTMPWMTLIMVEYADGVFSSIPERLMDNSPF